MITRYVALLIRHFVVRNQDTPPYMHVSCLRPHLQNLFFFAQQTAFTTKKDFGKEEREAQWAAAQRTLHGLQPPESSSLFNDKSSYRELSEIAEQAKRRAEVAR